MFERLQPAQSTRSLRNNGSSETLAPRVAIWPAGKRQRGQHHRTSDFGVGEGDGRRCAGWGPHSAGVSTSNQRCAPEHLESAMCTPPGPRVARLGSRPFLGL